MSTIIDDKKYVVSGKLLIKLTHLWRDEDLELPEEFKTIEEYNVVNHHRRTILHNDDIGVDIKFEDLKKGDKFELMDPDGISVTHNGYTLQEAFSNAYKREPDGMWCVSSEGIPSP